MMNPLDRMFDFNRDGRLDSLERAAEYQFLDDMEKDSRVQEEDDIFSASGLDRDELELMDDEEREEALEDAGLDPDDFDF